MGYCEVSIDANDPPYKNPIPTSQSKNEFHECDRVMVRVRVPYYTLMHSVWPRVMIRESQFRFPFRITELFDVSNPTQWVDS